MVACILDSHAGLQRETFQKILFFQVQRLVGAENHEPCQQVVVLIPEWYVRTADPGLWLVRLRPSGGYAAIRRVRNRLGLSKESSLALQFFCRYLQRALQYFGQFDGAVNY